MFCIEHFVFDYPFLFWELSTWPFLLFYYPKIMYVYKYFSVSPSPRHFLILFTSKWFGYVDYTISTFFPLISFPNSCHLSPIFTRELNMLCSPLSKDAKLLNPSNGHFSFYHSQTLRSMHQSWNSCISFSISSL